MLNSPEPMEQLNAMRAGVEYRHPVQCRSFTVLLRPITANENLKVYANVQAAMQKLPLPSRNQIQEHVWLAREYLKMASTDDVGGAVGAITDSMLDYMTNDEILHLHKQYVMVMDKCNPALESLGKDKLQELVSVLKKKAETEKSELSLHLTELSFSEFKSVVEYLLTKND